MSRKELFEVVENMIEHMGVQAFTEEVMRGMSTDELHYDSTRPNFMPSTKGRNRY